MNSSRLVLRRAYAVKGARVGAVRADGRTVKWYKRAGVKQGKRQPFLAQSLQLVNMW